MVIMQLDTTITWWSCDYTLPSHGRHVVAKLQCYCTHLSWVGEQDVCLGTRLAENCTHECYYLEKNRLL